MADVNLILTVPQGVITATSLGVEHLARHHSPGSGKHFHGRKVFVDLAQSNGRPDFEYLDEGGWRNSQGDTETALTAVTEGKRTKTALSNNAFSCTPQSAYESCYLVKTGGEVMELEHGGELLHYSATECSEDMSPAEVAVALGRPEPPTRHPRLYMVISPIELLILSNLTPEEYAWYSTHRPGKIFRQVMFTELRVDQTQLAALSLFYDARRELEASPTKKTKTVITEDCINQVPFASWVGYNREHPGGLLAANPDRIGVWWFPKEIPLAWERAAG